MAVEGTPRFNAIQLMELSAIDFRGGTPRFRAKGAFVDTVKGNTYGQTTCVRFSERTLLALKAFQESVEQDLADLVFESTTDPREAPLAADPGGIGESLARIPSEHDVESV